MTDLPPYWQRRRDAKLANTTKHELIERQKQLKTFYEKQAEVSPGKCENCGKSLAATIRFHSRGHICHILEKSKFKSVATHEDNRWFGCLDCHTLYDTGTPAQVKAMPVFPELKKRFKLFNDAIAPEERRRIPKYFL